MLRTLALVGASVLVGLLHNSVSPAGIGLAQHPLEAVSELDGSRFLRTLDEAKAKWKAGVAFVDARASDFYRYQGHIEGAISLPVTEFDSTFPQVRQLLPPPDEEIVCYCSGYGCEESTELARLLMREGYRNVYVYTGGWPEWSDAGLPSEVEQP